MVFPSRNFLLFILAIFLLTTSTSYALTLTSKQIQHINIINGASAECMMDEFFMYQQNWQKIEGENGSNGIDGLYIKDVKGNIRDVLVAESKWNTSRIGSIKKGTIKQMSKAWILEKLKKAKPNNPNINNFDQIQTLIESSTYRARLFNLKPIGDDKLKIVLYRIKNKSDDKSIEKVDKSEIVINFKNPQNLFHVEMINSFNFCRRKAIERWFPKLDEWAIEQLLYDNHIDREDISRMIFSQP